MGAQSVKREYGGWGLWRRGEKAKNQRPREIDGQPYKYTPLTY